MPVRSLSSSVFKWPDAKAVDEAVRCWAREIGPQRREVIRIGYFGSYARGDWGVGSDLDLIIIVEKSRVPFISRSARWDVTHLPVPADVLVYTAKEWNAMGTGNRFAETVMREAVWVYVADQR